jgi:hypothetical protein
VLGRRSPDPHPFALSVAAATRLRSRSASSDVAWLRASPVGQEILVKWLAAAGLWTTRRERAREVHQPRYRRDFLGELVQIDGCDHDWFERRGPRCTLLVYVDDATGRLMELQFVESESAFDYFRSTLAYVKRHGPADRVLQRQAPATLTS